MNTILKGMIYITSRDDVIYNTLIDGRTRIVSMDEDDVLIKNDSILVGTCLLPPIEAKIAESDGNEQMYDTIYANHLLAPYQQQFISALMTYLYKGGNLILFLPEIGYDMTMKKFLSHMWEHFGIHIGIIGDTNPNNAMCYYDERCIPIWCNMIFSTRAISPYEYLAIYPEDAPLRNDRIMEDLISEISPYGNTINEKINYILHLHKQLHKNPKVRPGIMSIRR